MVFALQTLSVDAKIAVAATVIGILIIALGSFFLLYNLINVYPAYSPAPMVTQAHNWAGYLATSDSENPGPSVVAVNGSWTVPSVSDIGSDAFSAIWVGVGGHFDRTLIQVGTEQDFVGGGAVYSAWYEMLPGHSVTIDGITVSPGDLMQAQIRLIDANGNLWVINLTDVSTGQSFQQNFTYTSEQLSAEWIIERPEVNNHLSDLADFGSVTFSDCHATINEATGSISDFQHHTIEMAAQTTNNHTIQLTSVSALSNNGTQFTVTYAPGF